MKPVFRHGRTTFGPLLVLAILGNCGFAVDADPVDLSGYFGFGPLEIYKLEQRSKNLRAVDLDDDGLTDLVLIDNSHNRIDWLRQRDEPADAETVKGGGVNAVPNSHRFEHLKIPVDRKVVSLVTGDFNSDGRTDLAYIGSPDRLVLRFSAKEDPTDWTKRVVRRLPDLTEGTRILAAGDFNSDGRDDLAVLGKERTYVVLQDDEGTLLPARRMMNTSAGLNLLQAADLDGDGRVDLCYTASVGKESILCARLQTPRGTFGPELRFPLSEPRSVTLANIDSEPDQEILTIDSTTGRLAILELQRPEQETGELAGRLVQYGFGDQSARAGRDLAIGDVDGDDRLDVVVTDPENARMIVFRQHDETGLDLGSDFPGLVGAEHVRVFDFDGDNQDEVYVLSEEEQMVGVSRYEDGRLNFPAPLPVGSDPLAFEIADVNGDQKAELVVIFPKKDDTYSLQAFAVEDRKVSPVTIGGKDKVEIKLDGEPARIMAFEGNGDGRADFVIFLDRGRAPHVYLSDRNKGLVEMPEASGIGLASAAAGQVSIGTLLDPETDKPRQSLLVAQGAFARSLDLDEGRWRVVDQYNAQENGAEIAGAATLDLDGKPGDEIVLIDTGVDKLRALKADGDLYKRWKEVEMGNFPFLRASVADLDNNNREDLLLFGRGRFAVLYAGQTDPRLKEIASFESDLEDTFFIDSVAGDLNNDNYIDIAILDTQSHFVEILDVDPRLGPRHALHFPIFEEKSFSNERGGLGLQPREAVITDATGDGRADLVLLVHDRVVIYPQDVAESE